MKLLVIGKHGQLARSLAERAAATTNLELLMAGRPDVDLAVAGRAADAVATSGAEIVVNAAAYTAVDAAESDEDAAFRINAEAAGEIAEAAAAVQIPLIHISTDYVFDGKSRFPYQEDAATNPLSVYGRSKLAGEQAVKAAGSNQIVLRTSWIYSPFGRNFVRTMMAAAEQRDVLRVVDDQRGCPTSALDLADAILAVAAEWARGERTGFDQTFHVTGTGETSWCGFAQAIMDERHRFGMRAAEVQPIATADWPTVARRPLNSVLDGARFNRDFGFVMPAWQRSLRATVGRLAHPPQG